MNNYPTFDNQLSNRNQNNSNKEPNDYRNNNYNNNHYNNCNNNFNNNSSNNINPNYNNNNDNNQNNNINYNNSNDSNPNYNNNYNNNNNNNPNYNNNYNNNNNNPNYNYNNNNNNNTNYNNNNSTNYNNNSNYYNNYNNNNTNYSNNSNNNSNNSTNYNNNYYNNYNNNNNNCNNNYNNNYNKSNENNSNSNNYNINSNSNNYNNNGNSNNYNNNYNNSNNNNNNNNYNNNYNNNNFRENNYNSNNYNNEHYNRNAPYNNNIYSNNNNQNFNDKSDFNNKNDKNNYNSNNNNNINDNYNKNYNNYNINNNDYYNNSNYNKNNYNNNANYNDRNINNYYGNNEANNNKENYYNNNNYNRNNNNYNNNNDYNINSFNDNFRNNEGCINLDQQNNYDKNEFNKANPNINNINELDNQLDNFFNEINKDERQNENKNVSHNEGAYNIKNTIDNNKNKEKVQIKKNINEDLIKTMAILYGRDISSKKGDMKSYFTSLIYKSNLSKNFEYNTNRNITIFNQGLNSNNKDEINNILKTFLYFSYRTGLTDLKVVGCKSYTSDCGWGCMVRCSQMLLSKAYIEKKILALKKQGKYIDNSVKDKIREEVLALFNDNYLDIEEVANHPDYKYFWALYEKLAQKNPQYQAIQKIIPPYSIHILCKLGNCAGEFTSDINMINVITKINADILDEFNIINFLVGTVKIKTLIKEFCEEITTDFANVNNADTIPYNGIDYKLKKPGIIFISFRLGLDLLSPDYYKDIPKLFNNFRNNLGVIGGIKRRAYYFIGVQDNKLIFVDPHHTHEIKDTKEKNLKTYLTKHLYLLHIKEMRCQFSLAIGVFNAQQFNHFLEDVKWFSNNTQNFIHLE